MGTIPRILIILGSTCEQRRASRPSRREPRAGVEFPHVAEPAIDEAA